VSGNICEQMRQTIVDGLTDATIRGIAEILTETFGETDRFRVCEEITVILTPPGEALMVSAELLARVTEALLGEVFYAE